MARLKRGAAQNEESNEPAGTTPLSPDPDMTSKVSAKASFLELDSAQKAAGSHSISSR